MSGAGKYISNGITRYLHVTRRRAIIPRKMLNNLSPENLCSYISVREAGNTGMYSNSPDLHKIITVVQEQAITFPDGLIGLHGKLVAMSGLEPLTSAL